MPDQHNQTTAQDLPAPWLTANHDNTIKPLFIAVPEYLKLLGLGRTTGFQYLREGKVRSVRAGRKRLILLEDCERLAAAALKCGSL